MNKEILKHTIRYILMILIIILCCNIFKFSSAGSAESTNSSSKVTKELLMLFSSNRNLSESEFNIKLQCIDPLIRKIAHFSIYMLLGILLICCAGTYRTRLLIKIDISILLSCIYAITDEFHQHFVAGRCGSASDVGIDTIGASFGILIVALIFVIVKKIKNNNKIKTLAEKNEIINKKRKIIFIASTGGHLNELMQVKPLFNKYNYHIITERNKVDKGLKEEYGEKMRFLIYGTRKYPFKYFFKFVTNCFISLYYYFKFQPEVIVTTGTHTAVPMCYIGKMFGSKIIFIETFANRTTPTVSGKIVYHIADTFVVQWEEMIKFYPKAVCWGWIY